jgi:hypothetical protein
LCFEFCNTLCTWIADIVIHVYAHELTCTQVKEIALCSGDVLVFGGKSRGILHQVTAIEPATRDNNSNSQSNSTNSTVVHDILGGVAGRYNINFREL